MVETVSRRNLRGHVFVEINLVEADSDWWLTRLGSIQSDAHGVLEVYTRHSSCDAGI